MILRPDTPHDSRAETLAEHYRRKHLDHLVSLSVPRRAVESAAFRRACARRLGEIGDCQFPRPTQGTGPSHVTEAANGGRAPETPAAATGEPPSPQGALVPGR